LSDRHKGYARSQEWRRRRLAVFERDQWRCTVCNRFGQRLECDHIKPLAQGGTHDMANLRTICRPCHLAETRRQIKTHHVEGQAEWEEFFKATPARQRATLAGWGQ